MASAQQPRMVAMQTKATHVTTDTEMRMAVKLPSTGGAVVCVVASGFVVCSISGDGARKEEVCDNSVIISC